MNHLVVAISGAIAAGKSAFIDTLAAALPAVTTGFGDYVREEAIRRGLDASSRDVLQELGAQLKCELGDEEFVRRVLSRVEPSGDLIVDGVRHVEIADVIQRAVSPRKFVLIFLETDPDTRRDRAHSRGTDDAARLDTLATHSTERQVHDGSLRSRADLVLDSGAPIPELVATAVAFLRSN